MADPEDALARWRRVPRAIQDAIAGLTEDELDLRGGSDGWSIRETVHHLVEANLVASNIVVAALGSSGCPYDWSWLNPDRSWMGRTGYSVAPVYPALEMLRSLCVHIAALLDAVSGGLQRQVKLLDAPGADPRTVTVEEVLRREAQHAARHLSDVSGIRNRRGG